MKIKHIIGSLFLLAGMAFGQGQFAGGGNPLPAPSAGGLCLISTGAGTGNYAFSACPGSGTISSGTTNFLAIYTGATTVGSSGQLSEVGGVFSTGTDTTTTVSVTTTGSGAALTQTEIADPGAPGASKGSLYWNSTAHRLEIYNNNVGPKVVGTWAVTSTGGLQVGGSTQVGGINTEILVAGNASGLGVFTETSAGVAAFIPATNASATEFLSDNGTNFVADKGLQFTGATVASTTISTSTANQGLTIAPNGTGAILLNVGTAANPTMQATGSATNTGLNFQTTATCQDTGGTLSECFTTGAIGLGSAKVLAFSSTTSGTGSFDGGISRGGVGILDCGNGTAADTTCKFQAAGFLSLGTKFTTDTGCGTIVTSSGGATAGKLTTVGSTSCTVVITMGNSATAPNGWDCHAMDLTTVADSNNPHQTATTTTTASIATGTIVSGDVISFHCIGY